MERDNYTIPVKPDCIFTLKYGPLDRTLKVPFLGNGIYHTDPSQHAKQKQDTCDTLNTFIDCQGMPKFTLPLDQYKHLPYLQVAENVPMYNRSF
jgi:hypothetical protein